MVKLLLKYDVKLGDSLLHAINVEFIEGVHIICEASVIAKVIIYHSVNSSDYASQTFEGYITVLIIASST